MPARAWRTVTTNNPGRVIILFLAQLCNLIQLLRTYHQPVTADEVL